jgi:hypothetical protein
MSRGDYELHIRIICVQYHGGFEHCRKMSFYLFQTATRKQCHDRPSFIKIVLFAEVASRECRLGSLCNWIPDIFDVLDTEFPIPICFKRQDRQKKVNIFTNRL